MLVILESWSFFQSSLLQAGTVDTTPNLRKLAQQGILFNKFFTPAAGTARGVYTVMTGLPDVSPHSTATRNPHAIIKPLLANHNGYDFNYFIGGNVSWANVRALLAGNGPSHIFEQADFSAPKIDVWGVSDADLFRGTVQQLSQASTPFFAVIQTAGNHKPYTIPAHETGFERKQFSQQQAEQTGFDTPEALEAVRLMDYSVGVLMQQAKSQAFFDNTVFVFLGDHGIPNHANSTRLPHLWRELELDAYHSPLLLYAPNHLKPALKTQVASQVDLVATLANLIGLPFSSYSLGRNLLDDDLARSQRVFFCNCPNKLAVTDGEYVYMEKGKQKYLYALDAQMNARKLADADSQPQLTKFLHSYYLSAQHLLLQKQQVAPIK